MHFHVWSWNVLAVRLLKNLWICLTGFSDARESPELELDSSNRAFFRLP